MLHDPKTSISHAAMLRQAFVLCARFPTAAFRRSLGRVSVPVWLIVLSDQLRIVALVSRYLTNRLVRRVPSVGQKPKLPFGVAHLAGHTLCVFGFLCGALSQSLGQVAHVLLARSPLYSRPKPLSRSTCLC